MPFSRPLARCITTAAQTAAAAAIKPKPTSIAGTVPYHQAYVVLHSREPITELPPRPSSNLQRNLQLSTPGTLVNFGWWAGVPAAASGVEKLTTFTTNGTVCVAGVSEDATALPAVDALARGAQSGEEVHLLVCTHGSRDCRCGERGSAVVRALRQAQAERLASAPDATTAEKWRKVQIGEVAHVGGHAHAANVLVYPQGDWCVVIFARLGCVLHAHDSDRMGYVTSENAPALLDAIFHGRSLVRGVEGALWRGRRGLTKEEQLEMYSNAAASI
jgi:hypothetical protein